MGIPCVSGHAPKYMEKMVAAVASFFQKSELFHCSSAIIFHDVHIKRYYVMECTCTYTFTCLAGVPPLQISAIGHSWFMCYVGHFATGIKWLPLQLI